jgi:hypothetical protein
VKVRIKENSWLAKLAAVKLKSESVAIVFGRTIHLYNASREDLLNNREWLCHELTHIQQYQQYGFTGFITRYLFEWIKNGYYKNRFEVEARNNEKNENLIKQASFI